MYSCMTACVTMTCGVNMMKAVSGVILPPCRGPHLASSCRSLFSPTSIWKESPNSSQLRSSIIVDCPKAVSLSSAVKRSRKRGFKREMEVDPFDSSSRMSRHVRRPGHVATYRSPAFTPVGSIIALLRRRSHSSESLYGTRRPRRLPRSLRLVAWCTTARERPRLSQVSSLLCLRIQSAMTKAWCSASLQVGHPALSMWSLTAGHSSSVIGSSSSSAKL
mmetsp:Transcript_38179/g.98672  ORF Transcript_38179/g.98672 Transcript_38179/m.98672 type:complete len:219 (-) Transcript_38179:360-1016(-)